MAYTHDGAVRATSLGDWPGERVRTLAREIQLEFDFDEAEATTGRVGTFEEFLHLDPKRIVGFSIGRSGLLDSGEFGGGAGENAVRVWEPFSEGRVLSGMSVPFNGRTMDRQRYENLLCSRLEYLISADPKRAKDLLTGSSEHNPDLYTIALYNPSEDWAIQIMMCDQMMIRLSRIDWEKGEFTELSFDELPGLDEFVAII